MSPFKFLWVLGLVLLVFTCSFLEHLHEVFEGHIVVLDACVLDYHLNFLVSFFFSVQFKGLVKQLLEVTLGDQGRNVVGSQGHKGPLEVLIELALVASDGGGELADAGVEPAHEPVDEFVRNFLL